jgi:hypothetical protein
MGKIATKAESPEANVELVRKLTEVFNARTQLNSAIDGMREWFNHRQPGEDLGLRLMDCALWTANLQWLLVQAQIIAKGEDA